MAAREGGDVDAPALPLVDSIVAGYLNGESGAAHGEAQADLVGRWVRRGPAGASSASFFLPPVRWSRRRSRLRRHHADGLRCRLGSGEPGERAAGAQRRFQGGGGQRPWGSAGAGAAAGQRAAPGPAGAGRQAAIREVCAPASAILDFAGLSSLAVQRPSVEEGTHPSEAGGKGRLIAEGEGGRAGATLALRAQALPPSTLAAAAPGTFISKATWRPLLLSREESANLQ